MSGKERRFGGRSARIQASVHQAVEALTSEMDRDELTVPLIAARAGVTPSTIYRRWGGLSELMADVAVKRLRPIGSPLDTGTLTGDLEAWSEQFMEEMSSDVGRAMIRDVCGDASNAANACTCCGYTIDQLTTISVRAADRGETAPPVNDLIDLIVAPIMYRILYGGVALTSTYCKMLVARALAAP
ncbi:TetR/AcrR family transcriptional regulator [Pseudolabrys taiwanensis]|uniref:TetR/AcrR family transcriptional regulator n=1 Tax=Pseudolabrys taiwanensis TaxID=331696 RepID=A0A345ZTE9_9HYPH|nr:TetR/AcrR family transcriptional regulator [Pseudolabrys taiwanensis]AXK80196.1 TetR/AcrR family transcriptional regulator [Pseudolabrys taiwanensis]